MILCFISGYIFRILVLFMITYTITGNFVGNIAQETLKLVGTAVYKISYIDQLCAKALEISGEKETAKIIKNELESKFSDWRKEVIKNFIEDYPEQYKWQLKFNDWDGAMNELSSIYIKEKLEYECSGQNDEGETKT